VWLILIFNEEEKKKTILSRKYTHNMFKAIFRQMALLSSYQLSDGLYTIMNEDMSVSLTYSCQPNMWFRVKRLVIETRYDIEIDKELSMDITTIKKIQIFI
jgi:hypothetical protein